MKKENYDIAIVIAGFMSFSALTIVGVGCFAGVIC